MPRWMLAPALLPALVAAALVAAACGGGNDNKSPTQAPAAAAASPTTAAANPTASTGGAANNITMVEYSFSPGRFTERAGQQVRLTVTNQGSLPHTFTVDGLVDSGTLSAGETKVIEFTPSQAGTFTYYCKIHGAARMSGQLTVAGTSGELPPAPSGGQSTSGSTTTPTAPPANYDYGY